MSKYDNIETAFNW